MSRLPLSPVTASLPVWRWRPSICMTSTSLKLARSPRMPGSLLAPAAPDRVPASSRRMRSGRTVLLSSFTTRSAMSLTKASMLAATGCSIAAPPAAGRGMPRGGVGSAPIEDFPDFGEELFGLEGLGEIFGDPEDVDELAANLVALGRYEDDRSVLEFRVVLEGLADLEAVHLGHDEVHEDEGGPLRLRHGDALFSVRGEHHLVTLGRQDHLDQPLNGRAVVYVEDLFPCHRSPRRRKTA